MTRSTLKDFEVLSRLGSGSFGTVFRVRRIIDDGVYVIKTVRIVELSYKEQTEAINEVQILAQLKSPYVVRYYDSFIEKDSLHIVMEFCNRGDLQNLIRKAKEKNVAGLKENVIWNIAIQVMLGLYYLHKKHILHRDLKSANVFLMKDESKTHYLVKIGDLGVAKLMDTSTALASTIVGTPYYLSPELCMDMPYRDKSDCWAFGVLIYESCTLEHPFEARNQCALIMKIIEAVVKPPPASSASKELRNLILWLLQKDPNLRPSIKDIMCEQFVRDKMDEHRFDIPAELQDSPISNHLLERDFEKDQQSRKRRSSIKVLSEISQAQTQVTDEVADTPPKDEGITYDETANPNNGANRGRNAKLSGNKAPPRQGSESPVSDRRAQGAAAGRAGRDPSPNLANYPAVRGSTRRIDGSSPTNVTRSQDPSPQQFMIAGSALRGKSVRSIDGGNNDPPAPSIRGDRVRGPSFRERIPSDRALNRHQIRKEAESKNSDHPAAIGKFMRGQSKKLDDEELDVGAGNRRGHHSDVKAISEEDITRSHSIDDASQTLNPAGIGIGHRADSKVPSDYEDEEFEAYESMTPVRKGENRSANSGSPPPGSMPPKVSRMSFKAEVEDLDDTVGPSKAQLTASRNRGKSFKEIDAEAEHALSTQSSPFRDTDSTISMQNLQISGSTSQGDSWDPVWTQGRGVINSRDHSGEVSHGGRLQRAISDTAEFAMGPKRTETSSPHLSRLEENQELVTEGGVDPPTNEEIGALVDLIEEARSKAIHSLGLTIYRKVYDLCAKHMNSPTDSNGSRNDTEDHEGVGGTAHIGTDERGDRTIETDSEPTLPFIKELEKLLCDQTEENGATIEMACEAVFGIKLLLALESKYESHAKHMNDG